MVKKDRRKEHNFLLFFTRSAWCNQPKYSYLHRWPVTPRIFMKDVTSRLHEQVLSLHFVSTTKCIFQWACILPEVRTIILPIHSINVRKFRLSNCDFDMNYLGIYSSNTYEQALPQLRWFCNAKIEQTLTVSFQSESKRSSTKNFFVWCRVPHPSSYCYPVMHHNGWVHQICWASQFVVIKNILLCRKASFLRRYATAYRLILFCFFVAAFHQP